MVIFDNKANLSYRYLGPYEIFPRVGKIVYEFELRSESSLVHLVFHESMLKKCIGNPESIPPIECLSVKESLSYKDFLVEILDHQGKCLRNKEVASVQVLFGNHLVKGETLESEADMKSRYPHLFDN